jgi:outer membrane protein OmpA-like peptidoglycan-associated protein
MAGGWVGAMVACAVGICVVAWLMLPPGPKPAPVPARVETPAAPAAKVEAPAPPAVKAEAPVPSLPARLQLTEKDGTLIVAGAVHDEATRASIMDLVRSVFGADKVAGDLTVDPRWLSASWMPGLRAALEALKGVGPHALFEGNGVTVNGVTSRSGRDGLLAALRAAMGSGLDVSVHMKDKIEDLLALSSDATTSGLAALPEGFSPDALVKVLNLSIVNFDSGSFAIPDSATELLRQAAAHIKQLPAGTKLLVAGYTDNTGDPDANLRLSGQRAGAVRDFLAADGVDAAMLDAKGFGADSPVAPNDSAEGRFRNRRIEYRLAP